MINQIYANSRLRYYAIAAIVFALAAALNFSCGSGAAVPVKYDLVETFAGKNGEFSEPFGIAFKGGKTYLSDGEAGKIWEIEPSGKTAAFAEGLDTPSGIAFDKSGDLWVADSGTNTILRIDSAGKKTIAAGISGKSGFNDGVAANALFNGPIGIAAAEDGKVYIADTYNDRIRVLDKGNVSTVAGGSWGFSDGPGPDAKFFTPCGVAIWSEGKVLVADTGNRRIRVIEPDGRVWTLAGNENQYFHDGLLTNSGFVSPAALTVDKFGSVFVADGNAIRRIGGNALAFVSTIDSPERGFADGRSHTARVNRPSGLTIDGEGRLLVADSDNRVVRRFSANSSGLEITPEQIEALRDEPEEFRKRQPPRWPYSPADAKREIAGTMGEIRGSIPEGPDGIHFHNGLDIAGGYGETARFVRSEKVLHPFAAQNFNTLRELLRMPSTGYIHVRLGRDSSNRVFGDGRFQFMADPTGKMVGVRIPRGTKFIAGEPVGTLNAMNHVHLIAGRSGTEMNALDALVFPGITDSRTPAIEKVMFFDEAWNPLETTRPNARIILRGKTRIVVKAYDQVDGNAERRRLGLYQAGYQVLKQDNSPAGEVIWSIKFDRLPAPESAAFVYGSGSKSGATGETIFNYIVTNRVEGDSFREDFLDASVLDPGQYTIRVFAADYFNNIAQKDISIEIIR